MSESTKRGRFVAAGVLAVVMTGVCGAEPRQTVSLDYGGYGYFSTGGPDTVLATGGNPDEWTSTTLYVGRPEFRSAPLHPFYHPWLGNYRFAKILDLGLDLNVLDTPLASDNRPLSVVLENNNHTPDDPLDDCQVVLVGGKHALKEGRGWKSYDFNIPYDSRILPSSWSLAEGTCKGLTPDQAWQRVIVDVTAVLFVIGDPNVSYEPRNWNLGFDNVRLTIERDGVLPFAGPPSVDLDQP